MLNTVFNLFSIKDAPSKNLIKPEVSLPVRVMQELGNDELVLLAYLKSGMPSYQVDIYRNIGMGEAKTSSVLRGLHEKGYIYYKPGIEKRNTIQLLSSAIFFNDKSEDMRVIKTKDVLSDKLKGLNLAKRILAYLRPNLDKDFEIITSRKELEEKLSDPGRTILYNLKSLEDEGFIEINKLGHRLRIKFLS